MSKTPIWLSLEALPENIRPFIDTSENGQIWSTIFTNLYNSVCKNNIVSALGLTPRKGKHSVIGSDALGWVKALLSKRKPGTIQSGRPLRLDGDQEKKIGFLKTPGEQAIILEDRWSTLKMTKPDIENISNVSTLMLREWRYAVDRRRKSTLEPEKDESTQKPSEHFVYERLLRSVKEWLEKANEPDYKIDENILKTWKQRLFNNYKFPTPDDTEYQTYIQNLIDLRVEIIESINKKQGEQNIKSHASLPSPRSI